MTGWQARHAALLDQLEAAGHLASDWRPSFEAVPRHNFVPDHVWRATEGRCVPVDKGHVPEAWWDLVYSDESVVTQIADGRNEGHEPTSSSSMPSMVAKMLQRLQPSPAGGVLEIGTGTGWNAALLAHRFGAGNVTTVEVDQGIAARARTALRRSGRTPEVIWADGARGWARNEPYGGIIVTCSLGTVPYPLVEQCAAGGTIVAPIHGAALVQLTRQEDGAASGPFVTGADFMPMRSHRPAAMPAGVQGWKSPTTLDTRCVLEPGFLVYTHGRAPELHLSGKDEGRGHRAWVIDGRGSGAIADGAGSVIEYGPRSLWEEIERLWVEYERHGRPAFDRFGLTVSRRGECVWLNSPDRPVPIRR
ncbi:methyltransferase domain-containing protein [Streptomyces sp. NPDC056149]|uniref:methyltransferase domain-containing protein n=1 Tax=unclassified Streptomyces TaxID=2593676 RepID=UPI002380D5B7|nr:methyltransferase domain-containing protein [Streptomyces sp. WZ-12]